MSSEVKPTTCPKCGKPLEHVRLFNAEIFGEHDSVNPWIGYVCRNDNCQGWWCDYDGEWHPYGTSCAVAMVRNMRSHTDYEEQDPNWKHAEKDVGGTSK